MNIPSINNVSGSSPAADLQRAGRREEPAELLPPDVRGTGSTTGPGVDANSKRLRAYAKKIGTRLQNALASPNLTPRQRGALDTQVSNYRSLMSKLEASYLQGTGTGANPVIKDVHKQLEGIARSVQQALIKPSASVEIPPATQQGGFDTVA